MKCNGEDLQEHSSAQLEADEDRQQTEGETAVRKDADSSGDNGEPEPTEQGEEEDLKGLLAAKEEEIESLQQRYLRLAADFENFRRRTQREAAEIRRTANEALLRELLQVVDNFERALEAARSQLPENLVTGIEMIYKQLGNILTKEGVQPIESVGKPFDPLYQEAFEQVETTELPDGTVTEEIQKGYLLQGKVLRPALVKVAKKPAVEDKDKSTAIEKEVSSDE